MVTNMDIMVTLGELWHTKPSVLWSLLTPSVLWIVMYCVVLKIIDINVLNIEL